MSICGYQVSFARRSYERGGLAAAGFLKARGRWRVRAPTDALTSAVEPSRSGRGPRTDSRATGWRHCRICRTAQDRAAAGLRWRSDASTAMGTRTRTFTRTRSCRRWLHNRRPPQQSLPGGRRASGALPATPPQPATWSNGRTRRPRGAYMCSLGCPHGRTVHGGRRAGARNVSTPAWRVRLGSLAGEVGLFHVKRADGARRVSESGPGTWSTGPPVKERGP